MRAIIHSLLLGTAAMVAASCTHKDSSTEERPTAAKTGKVGLALEATSDTGKVYRLRNATFPVSSFTNGSFTTLRSDDDPSKPVLEAFLAPGSYSTFLQDGW